MRRRVRRRATLIPPTTIAAVVSVLLVVVALLAPLAGEAQHAASLPRIGFLAPAPLSDPQVPRFLNAFRQGLRESGYVEGQNIAIEFRSAEGQYDRLPGLAAELVRLKVNVILAAGPLASQVAKQATETIPIVMASVADPVGAGFVASLARPGGNITGLSLMHADLVTKQLDLLKEVLPKVSRVAVLGNPANPNTAPMLRGAQDAARALGVWLLLLEARDPSEIDRAFAPITTERAGALIILGDTVFFGHRTRIADHALRRRLPTVFGASEYAEVGGLLAYGPSLSDGYRRAATYVDKILKGATAADRPVEQPTTFERVINLKAATALGLTIPRAVLQRADRVIQ
jgi:putative ABC transport system substrate-binding protein